MCYQLIIRIQVPLRNICKLYQYCVCFINYYYYPQDHVHTLYNAHSCATVLAMVVKKINFNFQKQNLCTGSSL